MGVNLLKKFNMLVTTSRGLETDACSEIWSILREMGDENPKVEMTGVRGLIAVETKLNPFNVVKGLRRIIAEKPWEVRHAIRVIPIERVVPTKIETMKEAVRELSSKIGEGETFRVTVEKRRTSLRSMDIIRAVAEDIDRKVNLEKPDRIVLIEVVGGLTGISVIRPEDILSVRREREEALLSGG